MAGPLSCLNALEFVEITKSFGSVRANDKISFIVPEKSIYGLVGENGSGKSTLMKSLFGIHQPDSGKIVYKNKVLNLKSPIDAIQHGIGMVHQHFMLVEDLSVLDNVILLQNMHGWQILPREKMRRHLMEMIEQYHLKVNLDARISDLSVGEQQRVEILKLLSLKPDVLILDEPTAVLTPAETDEFFVAIRSLKDAGKTILLITHKLKEVKAVTDYVSILRHGQLVHSYRTQDVSIEKIAEDMIGERNIGGLRKAEYTGSKIDILASTQWCAERNDKAIVDIDLRVRSGEIVGIAGVEGNGQDVLLDSLFQPTRMRGVRGQMRVLGVDLSCMEPAQIRQLPIAIFPEDRLRLGAVAEMSAWENFILGYQRKLSWWIDPFAERKKTLQAMQDFDVRPQLPEMLFNGFSGGNQQKLVVARELNRNPQLIVAAHPTRGVDIGAIRMIHQNLLERRASGCGVLLITTELDELLELADRIHVIFRGRFVAHFERKDFQVQLIGQAMGGKTL